MDILCAADPDRAAEQTHVSVWDGHGADLHSLAERRHRVPWRGPFVRHGNYPSVIRAPVNKK